MFLKRLDIVGFKSVADPVALFFDNRLTCVVGPNGSGKSNIADAVRWALGEQSAKTLRGKKSEDMIFSGTETRSRMSMAEVSLTLENPNPTDDVPQAEIKITRRLYRNGESEYEINGVPSRLQDVSLLLSGLRCGQKRYAVIGQGMVEQVILATPKEREEFFQEATGVRAYHMQLDQSLGKLDKSEQELERLRSVVREIEPRLKFLKKQCEKRERHSALESELKHVRDAYYRSAHSARVLDVRAVRSQVETYERALREASDNEAEIAREEKVLWDSDPGAQTDAVRKKLVEFRAKYAKCEREEYDIRLRSERGADGTTDRYVAELASVSERIRTIDADVIRKKQLLESNMAAIDALEVELDAAERRADAGVSETIVRARSMFGDISILLGGAQYDEASGVAKDGVRLTQTSLDRMKNSGVIAKEISEIERTLSDAKTEHAMRMGEIAEKEKQLDALRESDIRLKSLIDAKDFDADAAEVYDRIKKKLTELSREIVSHESVLSADAAKREHWQSAVRSVQEKLRTARAETARIRDELAPVHDAFVRAQTKLDDIVAEMSEYYDSDDDVFDVSDEVSVTERIETASELKQKMDACEKQLARIGDIDDSVSDEYAQVNAEYEFIQTNVSDVESAIRELETVIADLRFKIEKQFNSAFSDIQKSFSEYFSVLFGGGKARLILHEEEIINEETGEKSVKRGIDIVAVPPGKKNQGVEALSGGEKALTAIALIAAIIKNNPAPFIVLDEVDAALDDANAQRFAEVVRSLQERSQIIAITHNRATMHNADALYGVTMRDSGVSSVLSVSLRDIEE